MAYTILIAEDSPTMRSLLASTLEELGDVTIVETGSGFEALKFLPRHRFDLIITDINMPDINGLELVHFVKSNPEYRKIPLIIISTERSARDQERGLALGADAYLVKPFLPKTLQDTVTRLLPKGKS
ncbi:MAG TPA: response regulator [Thermodesulfobacteriota bacterium]|nr:response regulator [Thermodesulfobacteriota bacterium]